MRVITLARKPLIGTVADNVQGHGSGALHIDACRIGTEDRFGGGAKMSSSGQTLHTFEHYGKGDGWVAGNTLGRWPANVILEHLSGCERVGSTEVKSNGHFPKNRGKGSEVSGPSGHVGQEGLVERRTTGEVVSVWNCEPGCPVAALDGQTASLLPQGAPKQKNTKDTSFLGTEFGGASDSTFYGDAGGASRFFKKVRRA